MSDLVVWLRQQLDTDERLARAAGWHRWEVREGGDVDAVGNGKTVVVGALDYDARHIAEHDPARVLRQVQAHRAILDLYEQTEYGDLARLTALEDVMERLVSIYSDRDGYRQEWSA